MSLASIPKVVLGSFAFVVFWVLAVFPAVPFLPIGRTAGSLGGAMLMVLFQVIEPEEAYNSIDLPILGLLFGTMVVSAYLERADMFVYLGKLLSWKTRGPKDLMCRICLISAFSSALFTNDTTCVVLTQFVLKIARQQNIPPHPFLLAIASSANIGSSATPIGNPQNLVIAVKSKIKFWRFLKGIFPAMILGVVVNAAILLCMFWKLLSVKKKDEESNFPEVDLPYDAQVVTQEDAVSHRFSPARMAHWISEDPQEIMSPNVGSLRTNIEIMSPSNVIRPPNERLNTHEDENDGLPKQKWKRILRKTCAYLITIGMLISLVVGLDMSWTAITAALLLVTVDFKDATPCLDKVSYQLLVYFCGMFITIDGFNKTGIPGVFWDKVRPYAKVDNAGGIAILSIIILVMSNVASNVSTVLLLGSPIAASAAPSSPTKAWLILAWASTVGGNLSIPGSAANIIVCEQARLAQPVGYNLTFWRHLMFGVPSTIIVTAIGSTLISLSN